MDLLQIGIAVILAGAAIAVIVWLQVSAAAASAASSRRTMAMMKHLGLDPRTVTRCDRHIGKELGRRCMRCQHNALCDRWLAGEVKGGNTFCPNAEAFRILALSPRLT